MANASLVGNASKFGDLKQRIFFLIGALIVYRIGAHVPVPGINPVELAKLFQSSQTGLLDMFNIYRSGCQVHTFYYLHPHTGIYIIIGIQHKARRSFRATCMPIISFFDPSH